MKEFQEYYINIGNKEIVVLKDEKGTKWYPLNSFFKKILYRECVIKSFRDSNMMKYMQVIEHKFKEQKGTKPLRTWFMNEEGIKYLLKHINVAQAKSKVMELRNRGTFEACQYFNVKREEEVENKYTTLITSFKDYSEEQRAFLEMDNEIKNETIWKKCSECKKFFPDNRKYFGTNSRGNLRNTCKNCSGEIFTVINKDYDKAYQEAGIELINALNEGKNCKVLEIIVEKDINFAPNEFKNRETLIQLINYIKKYKKGYGKNFNLYYMSNYIKMSPLEMQKILEAVSDDFKIGFKKALPEDLEKDNIIKDETFRVMCKEKFGNVINPKDIPIEDIEPIAGVVTKKGLVIVCKNPQKISYAKMIEYNNEKKEINKILKRIERMN